MIFPFEKNRYFPYKRMRAEDFQRELQYMDHKLQCLHRWNFGSGIAFGLHAQRLDSESLMVSPGLAVDRQGRYLLVDEPAVCRIQTLKGFSDLQTETAALCLSYREDLRKPVPVPGDGGKQEEYSVSAESFEFFLRDFYDQPMDTVDQVLHFDRMLYGDETVRVRQMMPAILSSDRPVRIRLVLENLTAGKLTAELHYAPSLPGFHMEGKDGILLDEALELPGGETLVEITLLPDTSAQSTAFTLEGEDFRLNLRHKEIGLQAKVRQELKLVSGDPTKALIHRLLELSAQELWGDDTEGAIPVAAIRLVRQENQVRLDEVLPIYHQERAHLPAMEQRIDRLRAFFPEPLPEKAPVQIVEPPEEVENPPLPQMTTGVVLLHADLHTRKSKVLCSEEISHNLGPGTVYMDFGLENVHPSDEENRNVRNILMGDASLFIHSHGEYEHNFDRGIRIHPEKGTFELAVRLKGKHHEPVLQLRWFAWRPEQTGPEPDVFGELLRLEPNVVYAKPGEEIHFMPIFRGTSFPCEYFVPEKRSGLITTDGVYTAPEQEGLYQVCVQAEDLPKTRASAFVIVRTQEEGAGDAAEEL